MSAVVTIDGSRSRSVEVPKVDRAVVDDDGMLRLHVGYGDPVAVFRACHWEYVIISPERGPDGRFVKKGS